MARGKRKNGLSVLETLAAEAQENELTEAEREEPSDDIENENETVDESITQNIPLQSLEKEEVEAQPKRKSSRHRSPTKKPTQAAQETRPQPSPETLANESLDIMTKHWERMRDISQTISTHLERIQVGLNEMHSNTKVVEKPKTSALNKVAFAISFFSLVLSLVGLTLAQNARHSAIQSEIAMKENVARIEPVENLIKKKKIRP